MSKLLAATISPNHYRLAYQFDLDKFTFGLTETIDFVHRNESASLTFHGVGFAVGSALLDGEIAPISIALNAEDQTITLDFHEQISLGEHTLELKIDGTIGEELHGLYRSCYRRNNVKKWLYATQFEAVHAREAFACIDEPAAKARFEVSITAPASQTVLANTATIREITLASGRIRHEFATTPVMSTYLVAFVVGELTAIQATTKNKTLIRVFAASGQESQLEFALDTAVRALEFYEDYFDIPYPLPKLDMVAIPDFASGAMENWGLVTYRETALLLDPQQTSLGNRQRVAEVIAHELAHQWFGNLVTMSWWNDLWLNEGFASWMEVMAQDSLFPDWSVWEQFTSEHYARALELDGLANSHPIDVPVEDPRELDEIFDAVSYSKGAAIINMVHSYVGAEVFRDGLRQYIKTHAYSNAVTNDLWKALETASGRPIIELMSPWTTQAGYPVLQVKSGTLTQARFLQSGKIEPKQAQSWIVPVSVLGTDFAAAWEPLLRTDSAGISHHDWIKLNPGQTGFFRIVYDSEVLDRALPALSSGRLGVVDRFGIINDLFATTEAGLTSSSDALKLTLNLRHESGYVPSIALRSGFDSLLAIIESVTLRERFKSYGAWLNQPNFDRLGWTTVQDESYFDQLLRPMVLQTAVKFGFPAAVARAQEIFESQKEILPDIRPAIYYAAARYGDAKTFDELLSRYENETVPQERMRLLGGLCRFRQPELITCVLELGISTKVRSQDTIFVLAWSFLNREAREITWRFVQDNWGLFVERYGGGGHMLDAIPQYAGLAFATKNAAREVESFFAQHHHPSITRPVAQAVESIRIRAAWYDRDQSAIEAFLDNWEASR